MHHAEHPELNSMHRGENESLLIVSEKSKNNKIDATMECFECECLPPNDGFIASLSLEYFQETSAPMGIH
jgi:hypothetical protein